MAAAYTKLVRDRAEQHHLNESQEFTPQNDEFLR